MNKEFEKYLVIICRLILGGVFIYASIDKIANPAEFAKAVGNYHVLPFGMENLVALNFAMGRTNCWNLHHCWNFSGWIKYTYYYNECNFYLCDFSGSSKRN